MTVKEEVLISLAMRNITSGLVLAEEYLEGIGIRWIYLDDMGVPTNEMVDMMLNIVGIENTMEKSEGRSIVDWYYTTTGIYYRVHQEWNRVS